MTGGEADNRPSRKVDTSGREARSVVAEIATRLEPLRGRIALIAAKARRHLSDSERADLFAECDAIRNAVSLARTDLMSKLMEAPRKVAGHSRVVDIEKALDSLEGAVTEASTSLAANGHRETLGGVETTASQMPQRYRA